MIHLSQNFPSSSDALLVHVTRLVMFSLGFVLKYCHFSLCNRQEAKSQLYRDVKLDFLREVIIFLFERAQQSWFLCWNVFKPRMQFYDSAFPYIAKSRRKGMLYHQYVDAIFSPGDWIGLRFCLTHLIQKSGTTIDFFQEYDFELFMKKVCVSMWLFKWP